MRSKLLLATMGAGLLAAQQQTPKEEGARDLFFAGTAPKDQLPAISKPPATAAKRTPTASAADALHLGLRYTLLLARSRSDLGVPVDPASRFKKGDCVAVQVETNRSGYLYVLAKESDGNWTPLLPSPELADQNNRIDPGEVIRVPKGTCVEIDDPPGSETLFMVLSRAPRDIYELSESLKTPKQVNTVVAQMTAEAGTRDLPFREVVSAPPPARKAAPKEPPHAVYVVNGSSKAGATLVTQIEIAHR